MILRTLALAALAVAGGLALAGNPVPLALLAVTVILSLPLLDRLGYHPTRPPRSARSTSESDMWKDTL